MSDQAYVGSCQRTFQQALIHKLETEYGLLGSGRVLALLAKDVQILVDQFYPAPQRLSSGWLVFTGTQASGPKAYPGQRGGEHQLVTLAWPVLLPEDIQQLANSPRTKAARQEWLTGRLVRLIEYGCNHAEGPVLLTTAELGAMLGVEREQVSKLLKVARSATGKPLPTKGYYFDQGLRPTHKAEIIGLYEAGLDEAEIARQSGHAPESVGRYIRDYERVKLLLEHGLPVEQVERLTGMQPSVIKAYVNLVDQYHPELRSTAAKLIPQT